MAEFAGMPSRQGLYDSRFEKDACGIGVVVNIQGVKSHTIVQDGLTILDNLKHRGAQGSDPLTGDGCGILTQLPDLFFRKVLSEELPAAGHYAVGVVFIPKAGTELIREKIEAIISQEGFKFLAWRIVPVQAQTLGKTALKTQPSIWQFFVGRPLAEKSGLGFDHGYERKLYILRRRLEMQIQAIAIPSLSASKIVYKGLVLPEKLSEYFVDLKHPEFQSAIAMVHSRFSTNTFPTWALAHPYRYLSHNGEINTLRGNLNWMKAREGNLDPTLFGAATASLLPLISGNQSDSACLDNMLELLFLSGRSLPKSMMMLMPEPWSGNPSMDPLRRSFYEHQASIMEPWDGPAAVCFTDGFSVGATLDRNGLRPCRFVVTADGRVILSSEVGVLPLSPENTARQGRLEPGKMFLVDTLAGRLLEDEDIKNHEASLHPYEKWVDEDHLSLDSIESTGTVPPLKHPLQLLQNIFGYTEEERKRVLRPMVISAEEVISSMGTDTALAALSERPQVFFKYFKQLFAQVTNPPIDPIREQIVMSLVSYLGRESNLFATTTQHPRRVRIENPILTHEELLKISSLKHRRLSTLFPAQEQALEASLLRLCEQAEKLVEDGTEVIILTDRDIDELQAPIPCLLALSAVHQHLLATGKRAKVSLIVETAEARDVHHFACLIGFGANAVNPYLALEVIAELTPHQLDHEERYVKAINKGLLKIFSKMGISTLQSYCGAQLFEALGIHPEVVERFFNGAISRVGGIGLTQIARETLIRHSSAFRASELDAGSEIHYRVDGEHHEWNPFSISLLQSAVRQEGSQSLISYQEFSARADGRDRPVSMFRDLLEIQEQSAIELSEVEAASEIVKRFTTGAMSLGAISPEAHETLAVAMNRMGAKSNTGEGGEDPLRYKTKSNGDSANSAIKQVASARFGVTTHYLSNAREIQIKMAQGAKPGEGGQLPGHKVDATIARLRHSTPGVQLISPPPHHDIYSIEDLAQLIFDLKNVNPQAEISVKLVSEAGVGTVAAGVVKARADKILISGDSGGTGASPLSSIKNAGIPWEIGLAETHQTLLLNGLRSRVRIETDGQLRTGRDVIIAALLGAEEFGFATAPLIAQGCIMMRKCHLNTCPVGIATQDPVLREKFAGKPEQVVNYFFLVAEEVREWMAKLGLRSFDELVGRTDFLKMREFAPGSKAASIDLSRLLHRPEVGNAHCTEKQDHLLEDVLDVQLIAATQASIDTRSKITLRRPIANFNRATGAMLSGSIVKRFGAQGLGEDLVTIGFEGSAGQSFGAFLCRGLKFELEGQSNDYVAKGLSGGKVAIYPAKIGLHSLSISPILIGNTALYGATEGQLFVAGHAGERFAVRNSGATAVVEGIGDHGCEYMTGGTVVVLGKTGRNFAAGMSGGIAYVLDEDGGFLSRCNPGLVEVSALCGVVREDEEVNLKNLIELHLKLTKSVKAEIVLENWEIARTKFLKVIPYDYKNVLMNQHILKAAHV